MNTLKTNQRSVLTNKTHEFDHYLAKKTTLCVSLSG